jgi:cation:H+ antiporter
MLIVTFLAGLALLYLGGEGLVRGAAAIGIRLHMSPTVIGLTIVAFATSAPELAISVGAALRGLPGLAVGNVVGSNICNLAFVLGLTTLVSPAQTRMALMRRDALVMAIVTLLVPGLLLDMELARLEGALLVLCITAYIFLTVWHTRSTRHLRHKDENTVPILSQSILANLVLASISLALLVFGSELFVGASVELATLIGVSPAVVGLSAAALGSSLPELTASLISARHGHPEMAVGNLIGSNIFNLLMVLGVTAVARPLSSAGISIVDLGLMVFVTMLALGFMLTKAKIERPEGAVLVAIYIGYMGWLYYN